MQERYVGISGRLAGVMKTFVAMPDGAGPFDAVLLVQHVGGLSETMRVVARRIAAGGFLCAVPALYYRLGDIVIDPMSRDEPIAAIRAIAVGSLGREQVIGDISCAARFHGGRSHGQARPERLHRDRRLCRLRVSRRRCISPDDFGAIGVAVLGAGFINDTEDSPHLAFPRIRGELYFSFAGCDEILPAANVDALRAALAATSVPARVVVHPGVRHGYAFSNRAVYDEAAAEADWTSILSMFERQLAKTREPQHG